MNQTFLIILVAGMLFTGTVNTLLNKLQDLTCVSNCDLDPSLRTHFEQPLIQTLTMFIGELYCLILYLYQKKTNSYAPIPSEDAEEQPLAGEEELIKMEGYKNFLFLIPTMCDLTSTTLMNVGLIFTSASVYQMLRGSVVLFTGLFSTLFLGISHPTYRWIALFIVFLGVSIVGLSSLISSSTTVTSTPLGVFLVILAQGFTATQFVVEEKVLSKYSVEPMKAVGLEGFFGLSLTAIAIPILHYTLGVNREPGNPFDMHESFRQMLIPQVLYAGIGITISISFFNYCGLSVTRNISATSRSTIDTCRTLFIWIFSLAFGWEHFSWLQVVGFIVLIYGTFVFNDVVILPGFEHRIELAEEHVEAP